ncbi:MAG: cupredoxin family copper-binding protein [Thermomicrobiales bacterium]
MKSLMLRWMVMGTAAATLFAAAGTGATAQGPVDAPHPAHIHQGTCADLDPDVAYPLEDIAPVAPDAEPGSVEVGVTSVAVALDDLLAEPYAINVHESAENATNYIACGDIVGEVVDGTLVIGLGEQNGSGYSGVVALSTTNGEAVDVVAFLGFGLSGTASETGASPVAGTPVTENPAPEGTAVSILEYAFDAPTVEIPVGTTVTWTNDGGVIHTTTATDGLWDSGILSAGDEFSYTFNEAGNFAYVCTLHPTMVGTIVVTEP